MFLGAILVPLFKGRAKKVLLVAIPFVALATSHLWEYFLPEVVDRIYLPGTFLMSDRLPAPVFFLAFMIGAVGALMFALKVDDDLQHCAALVYIGAALGVITAKSIFEFYVFWEIMAVSSTFLVLAKRTKIASDAAFRYIIMHLFGGLCLLAGLILCSSDASPIGCLVGSEMQAYSLNMSDPGPWLIFIGIAVNLGIPPFHTWIKDAYPEATETGSVFLCIFTTKSAVFALACFFAGAKILIFLGAVMAIFPILFAVLENDIRRVLAYSLINQVGFMIVGIGIGTALSLSGATAHAFCHIIYKSLLFMATGSVIYMTGKSKFTDLGGLYKTMPLTCLFCIIGAASISAFPLFSGFVSKSMIVSAAGHEKYAWVWFILQIASAGGVVVHGIKIPYFIFFGKDSGIRASDPPRNMVFAMGLFAALCVLIGIFPASLYKLLPKLIYYNPYSPAHIVEMLQILGFGILAFVILKRLNAYPVDSRGITLDFDWFYIKGGRLLHKVADSALNSINAVSSRVIGDGAVSLFEKAFKSSQTTLLLIFVAPYYLIKGDNENQLKEVKHKLTETFEAGGVPIGIGAAVAVGFMVFCIFLSR